MESLKTSWYKTFFVLFLILLFMFYPEPICHGNQDPDIVWNIIFNTTALDQGWNIQPTIDGNYVVSSTSYHSEKNESLIILMKVDLEGNILWNRTYASQFISYSSVYQERNGDYIIAGISWIDYPNRLSLIKTDSEGKLLWEKTYRAYNFRFHWDPFIVAGDGGYLVAGTKGSDVYLLKTDTNGNILWNRTYGGSKGDYGRSVQQSDDGGYIIVGSTHSFGKGERDIYLIKTDSYGNIHWNKTYGGPNIDTGFSVRQTTDNGYIILGATRFFDSEYDDIYLIKINSEGDMIWNKTYGGAYYDFGFCIQQTSEGGYVVVGYTELEKGIATAYIVKTDIDGNEILNKTLTNYKESVLSSVQETNDESYIFTGHALSNETKRTDILLVKCALPEPEPEPEPEQRGIPGFPALAIALGIILSLLILDKIRS